MKVERELDQNEYEKLRSLVVNAQKNSAPWGALGAGGY